MDVHVLAILVLAAALGGCSPSAESATTPRGTLTCPAEFRNPDRICERVVETALARLDAVHWPVTSIDMTVGTCAPGCLEPLQFAQNDVIVTFLVGDLVAIKVHFERDGEGWKPVADDPRALTK